MTDLTEAQKINSDVTVQEVDNEQHENVSNKTEITLNDNVLSPSFNWTVPKLLYRACKEFQSSKVTCFCENFTKGCFWSPDGTCLLVPSEDFKIRIIELPSHLYSTAVLKETHCVEDINSVLNIKEGGTVYDTCWYPYMNSWNPITCCFLSTSQGSPIHLWDAFNGELRATYKAYNQVDEVEAALSCQFTDSGTQIWSGFKNALRCFDVNKPGRQICTVYLKKDFPNVSGLVSCIRENPALNGLIAFGTYTKCIGLYKDGPLCSFKTDSGVTQIEFSPCGTRLYSAVRRSNQFLCWDLRNPGTVLFSFENRESDTNQRIQFTLSQNENEIVSAGTDGAIRIWNIPQEQAECTETFPMYKIQITKDCVNGVSLHKTLPIVAVSTGCRIRKNVDEEDEQIYSDNGVRLYWFGDS